uniref:Uncharacterized protein n=1 Tax=Globodera rostochiensis TaxID=31243 RepID=A0A914GQB2_GLORO
MCGNVEIRKFWGTPEYGDHEAGHALAAFFLPKVTIVPRGDDLGHTSISSRGTDASDLDYICMLLAGGASATKFTGSAPGCEYDEEGVHSLAKELLKVQSLRRSQILRLIGPPRSNDTFW